MSTGYGVPRAFDPPDLISPKAGGFNPESSTCMNAREAKP